jgi:hypothetical protein
MDPVDKSKPTGEPTEKQHLEHVSAVEQDLVYRDGEHEPKLHSRTWIALAAIWLYNFVIVFALFSTPAVVSPIPPSDISRGVWSKLTYGIGAIVILHRGQSRCPEHPDMGAERPYLAPGGIGATAFFGLGRLSSSQAPAGGHDHIVVHRSGYCARVAEHIPAHRGTDLDLFWLLCRSTGIRDP